jgi:hypothetical protein
VITVRAAATAIVGTFATALALFPASGEAAFPGRDGELAVGLGPGAGVALVSPSGGAVAMLCQGSGPDPGCPGDAHPAFSPDGREIAVGTNQYLSILYPDGSCLFCGMEAYVPGAATGTQYAAGSITFTAQPAFRTNDVLSINNGGRIRLLGIDANGGGFAAFGRDPAWSSTGRLAVARVLRVRGAQHARRTRHPSYATYLFVTNTNGARRRRLTRFAGAAPNWSPDGRRLAAVVNGWVVVLDLRGRIVRRLARGSAPAFAPDGSMVAFLSPGGRLETIPADGGHVTPVGDVHATSVDWQPLPRTQPTPCALPAGWQVKAMTSAVLVTFHSGAVMTCPWATGDWHWLFSNSSTPSPDAGSGSSVTDVQAADGYVLYVVYSYTNSPDPTTAGYDSRAQVVDALAGNQPGPSIVTSAPGSLDAVALSADGYLVWEQTTYPSSGEQTETISAQNGSGPRVLDTATFSAQSNQKVLADLAVNGETVTWTQNGQPMSASLQP